MKSLFALLLLALAGCSGLARPSDGPPPAEPPARSFTITYQTELTALPVGEELRMWIPIPRDDPHQRIGEVRVEGPWDAERTTESVYGNHMLYISGRVTEPTMRFVVSYDVDRFEYRTELDALAADGKADGAEFDRYRTASSLAFVTAQVEREAKELAAGRISTLDRSRAFYDHVLENMAYDKNHHGWGRGSIEHACAVGKGNCTDYHTYFTSLCLASGIASRFQIGIYGKYDASAEEYETGGYHCWAEFRVPGKAWVPVDISEADKDPSRVDEFFGGHTTNRVTLSTGRDLILSPPQAGPPLNYFLYPHAEVGGQPLGKDQVRKTSLWKDRSGS